MNVRPPKIPYSNSESFGTEQFRKSDRQFIESLGYTIVENKAAPGWLKFKNGVPEHADGFGQCFVYCATGEGVLHIEGDEPKMLTPGQYVVFDDCKTHSLTVIEKPCHLLVANIGETE